MSKIGVFPGSFNPPTIAHLAIAEAAVTHLNLARLDLTLSRTALAKPNQTGPTVDRRRAIVQASIAHNPKLAVAVTKNQLLVDIAVGYDVVVVGMDKWQQIHQPVWYGSEAERNQALATLPDVVVVDRATTPSCNGQPSPRYVLAVDQTIVTNVSSTAARSGNPEMMTPAAADYAATTGAWVDQ